VAPVAFLASACTVPMMNGSTVAQDPQIAFFSKPAVGEFLCLSSVPNMPIYSRPGPDAGKIAPFHGAPGQRCIVPGRDRLQRPIFEID
jgi:hypothetical protein